MRLLLIFMFLVSMPAWAGIKIGTYNIRNFDYDQRSDVHTNKPELAQMLMALDFDLLGVNEINNGTELKSFIKAKMPGYEVVLTKCGGGGDQTLGFIYRTQKLRLIDFTENMEISNPDGSPACSAHSRPMAIGHFEDRDNKEKFYAHQVHLKAGDNSDAQDFRFKQFEYLKNYFKSLEAEGKTSYIVMGDFNTTGYLGRTIDYKKFVQMIQANKQVNLTDSVRCSAYWWGGSDDGKEQPAKLDHVVMSEGFLANKGAPRAKVGGHCQKVACKVASIDDLGVSYEEVSDHCPLTVETP